MCNGCLLAFVLAVGLFGSPGCSKEGDILTPTEPAPATNLRAASGDARVFLTWTASPDSGLSDFVGYRIVTKTALSVGVDSTNTASTASSYVVAGLVNGMIYTFTVQSVKTNGSVSQKVTIQWGPTARYGFQRLYEHESTEPSDLQFLSGQRLNFTIANKIIRVFQQRWRHTLFVETTASSLDDFVVVPDISAFRSTPGLPIVPGKVYFAIGRDGKYTKFRVEPPGVQINPASKKCYVNISIAYNSGTDH